MESVTSQLHAPVFVLPWHCASAIVLESQNKHIFALQDAFEHGIYHISRKAANTNVENKLPPFKLLFNKELDLIYTHCEKWGILPRCVVML